MMVQLWSINRVIRWTGFVLVVERGEAMTRLGFVWVGLPPERAWDRHRAKTLALHTDCSESPVSRANTAPITAGAE